MIEFDLRTAMTADHGPKNQPRWLEAAYGAYAEPQEANYQLQVGAKFPFDKCPGLAKPNATNMLAAAWLACEPLISLATSR